jgi:toxin CcdB
VAQFDLHRLDGDVVVVDLQTDLIGLDATRLVAPLREQGRYAAFPGLTPEIETLGRIWIVRVPEMAAVPTAALGPSIGSAASARDALKRAVDILIDGF